LEKEKQKGRKRSFVALILRFGRQGPDGSSQGVNPPGNRFAAQFSARVIPEAEPEDRKKAWVATGRKLAFSMQLHLDSMKGTQGTFARAAESKPTPTRT